MGSGTKHLNHFSDLFTVFSDVYLSLRAERTIRFVCVHCQSFTNDLLRDAMATEREMFYRAKVKSYGTKGFKRRKRRTFEAILHAMFRDRKNGWNWVNYSNEK